MIDGVKAVHSKFVNVLETGGVQVINPAGQAFDALECQAVATVDDASVPDETVHEVYQKATRWGRRFSEPQWSPSPRAVRRGPSPRAKTNR